jgi:hypothetical protein
MEKLTQIICTFPARIRKLALAVASRPAALFNRKQVMRARVFWHELNADYYNKYPETWEKRDLYLQGEGYEGILKAGGGEFERPHLPSEHSDETSIHIQAWKIWQVGKTYAVVDQSAKPGEFDQHILGELVLVGIRPGVLSDWLSFEVCDQPSLSHTSMLSFRHIDIE